MIFYQFKLTHSNSFFRDAVFADQKSLDESIGSAIPADLGIYHITVWADRLFYKVKEEWNKPGEYRDGLDYTLEIINFEDDE